MHEDEEQSIEPVPVIETEVEFDMSTYLASKAGEPIERSDTESSDRNPNRKYIQSK